VKKTEIEFVGRRQTADVSNDMRGLGHSAQCGSTRVAREDETLSMSRLDKKEVSRHVSEGMTSRLRVCAMFEISERRW